MCRRPPDVGSDINGLAELLLAPELRIERMHRRVDLYGGPEKREAANANAADVQHDAVEVLEHALTELDVCALVAEEGRLHPDRIAA